MKSVGNIMLNNLMHNLKITINNLKILLKVKIKMFIITLQTISHKMAKDQVNKNMIRKSILKYLFIRIKLLKIIKVNNFNINK
jgi:hypothetical protein